MNLHTIREITYGTIFFRLFLSIVIGGVLGLERGRKSRPAGLRTYILVCLGSTVVMMTNQYVSQCMNTGDPVRMGAQVLSGIGFIGAGSIMKTGRNQVRGITTAAGLWAAACIGLAIGIGFYEVAIAGGILIFIVLSLMQNMDYFTRKHTSVIDIYVELENLAQTGFGRPEIDQQPFAGKQLVPPHIERHEQESRRDRQRIKQSCEARPTTRVRFIVIRIVIIHRSILTRKTPQGGIPRVSLYSGEVAAMSVKLLALAMRIIATTSSKATDLSQCSETVGFSCPASRDLRAFSTPSREPTFSVST